MRRRNLIAVTLLSIFTIGIYDIYWAFSTRNELVKKGYKVPSPLIVLAPLLGLIVIALAQLLLHFGGPTGGWVALSNVFSVVIGLIAILAIIPMAVLWLWRYSKAVEAVTKAELTAEVSMVIAIVTSIIGFGFIWPIVVQYYFNKVATKS